MPLKCRIPVPEGEVIKMENDKVINCLMELLKGENFMSADYTNIALQNGTNLNVLREFTCVHVTRYPSRMFRR